MIRTCAAIIPKKVIGVRNIATTTSYISAQGLPNRLQNNFPRHYQLSGAYAKLPPHMRSQQAWDEYVKKQYGEESSNENEKNLEEATQGKENKEEE
ncbi:hypothetical protein LTR66_015165, partial [Elasticomyces elasticus]